MQVEGIYTAEPRFEAKAKALKLKQEMAAAAAEEQKRLRGMPGLDLVETPKPLERQIRAEVEARVPEEVWKAKTTRMFEKEPRKKKIPDFSNLKGVTGYGPDGGGSGRSGSIDIPSFWESTGQAAVGGATRSLGTQMDVWGTQYQRWQPRRSQMNAEQSSWYQEQYQSELRTYYSMLDENKEKPGTYSWAALENQKRILDEAEQRAGIFQNVDQYQKQAGEATRDLAQDTYLKGQNIVDQAANGRGARGQKWADFVANGTELLINSVIDKTLGPEAAFLYRMGNQYGAATMRAYANGKTLEQQHRAGTLSASGTAAGALLGSAVKADGTELLQGYGLQNNPFARAFVDGAATAGYVNGERGMGEVSDAVTYPESYRFDPNAWNRDTLTAWALGSVGSLLGQAFGNGGRNGRYRRNDVEGNNLPVPITPQPQLPGGQNASLLPAGSGAAWLLPRTNGSYMPSQNTSGLPVLSDKKSNISPKNEQELSEKEFDAYFERGYNETEDYEEWERYVASLGNNAPQTFEDFRNIKYSEAWDDFQYYSNAIDTGDLSPLASFDLYQHKSNEIDQLLVGKVAANGIRITGKSKHCIVRLIGSVSQRRSGVNTFDMLDTICNPLRIDPVTYNSNGKSQRFIGRNAVVTINPDTGNIIQVNLPKMK